MNNIYGYTRQDLENYFLSIGEKKFKATQVYEWLYDKKIKDFDEITNIKKDVIDKLNKDFNLDKIEISKVEKDNDTHKFLFKLSDNNFIEAVVMSHDYGNSLCVSSEVGCNMSCAFCESGRRKKVRNLETYEMVEQLYLIENEYNLHITSIVVMGIGEPFDNYLNVINFLKIINDPKSFAIGARHITVSTCGLVPKILEFSELPYQFNLAISLHAPNDLIRNKLMPINKVYNISKVMDAISIYYAKTNRRVTIEYVMLKGVNDSLDNAEELAKLLKGKNVYVNLIPYNETSHIEFKKSERNHILKFGQVLQSFGITVTIRKEFGSKISAACGQLRSKEENV